MSEAEAKTVGEPTWDPGDPGDKPEGTPNILNEVAQALVDQGETREVALAAAALAVLKARVQVVKPSVADVLTLAKAGEELAKERAALLVLFFQQPGLAFKPFDGGRLHEAQVMAEFRAILAGSGGG